MVAGIDVMMAVNIATLLAVEIGLLAPPFGIHGA